MIKIKTLLIDDDSRNNDFMEHYLSEYCPDIEVCGKMQNIRSAVAAIEENRPQLIFLDIELKNGESGFDLFDNVDLKGSFVVFVTAFNEYALKAFRYHVIDYILKPIVVKDLISVVENVRDKIREQTPQINLDALMRELHVKQTSGQIAIPSHTKIELVEKHNVVYLTSEGKYTKFHMTDGKEMWSSKNIGEYEHELRFDNFTRIHHSCMINIGQLDYIDKTEGWKCVMKQGSMLEVSRRKQEDLYEFLKINLRKPV